MKIAQVYKDILHIYLSDWFIKLPKAYPTSGIERVYCVLGWLFRDMINPIRTMYCKARLSEKKPENAVWLFASSNNHFRSLDFIKENITNSVFVVPHIRSLEKTDFILPYYRKVFYYPLGLLLIWELRKHKNLKYSYYRIFEAIGAYEISKSLLMKYTPKCIVFSNDHIIKHRALILAAQKLGVKTFYIQHASITKYFPKLKFDVSFLEGQDSLDKYQTIGDIYGETVLSGMPKFDSYLNFRKKDLSRIKRVGIATNMLDEMESISGLIDYLHKHLPEIQIVYRPHPLDKRILPLQSQTLKFSNSRESSPFEFMQEIDILISGDSSIHLEASLMNCPSAVFSFNKNESTLDAYDYIKKGLVKKCTPQEIVKNIERTSFDVNHEVLRYFNAAYGSNWEGSAGERILEAIKAELIE